MEDKYTLTLDFLHYWRCGTGKGSGSHVDATVELDEYGCPFVGGSMLKGLLRDAVHKSVRWGSSDDVGTTDENGENSAVDRLFGTSGFFNNRASSETVPGLIRVGNATLPRDTRQALHHHSAHRNALFRDLYATAIDPVSGTARKGSLRGQQVVVPLSLNAELSVAKPPDDENDKQNSTWVYKHHKALIERALPLIRAIGSGRTRGLGRVKLSLEAG